MSGEAKTVLLALIAVVTILTIRVHLLTQSIEEIAENMRPLLAAHDREVGK